ncbi:MAG: sulfate ABC transporter permease subunit [Microthrixaceae bacterium]|nr:sulfate ABC transporter permease subunit [Microthrixaceae bacterium]
MPEVESLAADPMPEESAAIPVPATKPHRSLRPRRRRSSSTLALRLVAVGYIVILIVVPLAMVAQRTFAQGAGAVWERLTEANMVHAFTVTAYAAAYAVIINTVFGIAVALLLVRYRFPGRRLLSTFVDLPLSVSPIVAGLALIFAYGRNGWFGPALDAAGIDVIFAFPGIVLATVFVSMPLVVREIVPVLEEIGTEQEQAATVLGASWFQTFRRITLPSIKWAVAYGVVLALARSLGEFGAVKVVTAGGVAGSTQSVTSLVEERYAEFDELSAYSASLVLAAATILCLIVITIIRPSHQK